jgi:hypothetical protein
VKVPNSQRPNKAQVRNNVKFKFTCFVDTEGIMHGEFLPPGQTVNGTFYCDVVSRLKENVGRKRPVSGVTIPGPCTVTSLPTRHSSIRSFWLERKQHFIPPPPISPHRTSPLRFSLVLKTKMNLKGGRFMGAEEIQAKLQYICLSYQGSLAGIAALSKKATT